MSGRAVDDRKLEDLTERVFGVLAGAVTAGMINLGDRLGLYRTLAAEPPMTSEELARKAGLHERWVREWVQGQATAGLVDYVGQGRFTLSPEAAMVLADETSPAFAAGGFHGLAQQMAVLDLLPDAFRTGQGFPYDALGREGAVGVERMLAPWFRTQLVPVALPALDGVVPKLERGARVADVGCGAGIALLQMAAAFPRSEFHGYEVSEHALARAEDNRRAAGAANVRFHDVRHEALAGPFDLVTTFDCLHDMAHPMRAMRAIREAIAPDGTWLIADVNCKATFEENLAGNPMASLLYGFSVMCCMSSALSEPDGAGLGTLGFTEEVARRMTAEAGFTRFARRDFDNPLNAYYEVRP